MLFLITMLLLSIAEIMVIVTAFYTSFITYQETKYVISIMLFACGLGGTGILLMTIDGLLDEL